MKTTTIEQNIERTMAGLRSTRVHRAGWENSVGAWHLVTEKIGKD